MNTSLHQLLCRCLVAVLCWFGYVCGDKVMAQASQEELSDLSGRIEYAFYSADQKAMRQTLVALEKLEIADNQRAAQLNGLNYGRWKLAQLLAQTTGDDPGHFADLCVESTEIKLKPAAAAEHEALTAACYAVLEQVRPLRRIWNRSARETHLEQAVKLGPKNVQVQFVAAWVKAYREPNSLEGYVALKQVVSTFADAGGRLQDSGWGYAEALYLLGKTELVRHDNLAARNALERALVIAPDYAAAQQLLKQSTVR